MPRLAMLRTAIELHHLPSRVKSVRLERVPKDARFLLDIAVGDENAASQAAELTGRNASTIREAVEFFVEQIFLYPGADSYRILAAHPDASVSELRQNMALLLKWLHPDIDRQGRRAVLANRVIGAWHDLNSDARRAAYDDQLRELSSRPGSSGYRKRGKRWIPATPMDRRNQGADRLGVAGKAPRRKAERLGLLKTLLRALKTRNPDRA
jgi:hypothetical protein